MPKRVDENQKEIVSTFRKLGFSVLILSDLGKGRPDLCVGFDGRCYLIEIKNGKNPPSGQKLTKAEQLFFDSWKGHAEVINSVEGVIRFVNRLKESVHA